MANFAFTQPERRSFLVPAIAAVVVLGGIFALLFALTPHRIADLSVTHMAILPTHTVFGSDSHVVGHESQAEDDLYVLATVRVDDDLKLPLFIKDITGTLVTADGDEAATSAVEKTDLDSLYFTFPKLKPLASAPLLRESSIQPGQHAEGMVLLHFPVTQAVWDRRKSASVTIDFYHQGPLTVVIPKP